MEPTLQAGLLDVNSFYNPAKHWVWARSFQIELPPVTGFCLSEGFGRTEEAALTIPECGKPTMQYKQFVYFSHTCTSHKPTPSDTHVRAGPGARTLLDKLLAKLASILGNVIFATPPVNLTSNKVRAGWPQP